MQTCRRCGQMHDAYTGCTLAVRAGRPTMVGEDEALVGNVVGERYQVGEVLGTGATGTVFGVTHMSFARTAAMKVLRPRYAEPELISRVFHGEARAAWSVSHPGLCEVFDIGSLPDGAPFFVMEKLEGETLAARIARERLSLASAIDMMMQLLSAIAAIHARDLLLRDLRPQNIFLAHRRGCRPLLKILDFGLARLTPLDRVQEEWDALRTSVGPGPGDAVGSTAIPFYLSPERTRSENGIEPASDLFVAAAILYEALAGERPFTASSFNGVLVQICQGKAPPLHDRRADISHDLSAFVARGLSPNPRARSGSAKDMQDELRAIFEEGRRGGSAMSMGHAGMAPSSMMLAAAAAPDPHAQDESTFATIAPAHIPGVHLQPHPAKRRESASLEKVSPSKRTDRPAQQQNASQTDRPPSPNPHTSPPPINTDRPPSGSYERDASGPGPLDDYADETTKREALAKLESIDDPDDDDNMNASQSDFSAPPPSAHTQPRMGPPSLANAHAHSKAHPQQTDNRATASGIRGPSEPDEASADNSDRTMPPPPLFGSLAPVDVVQGEIDVSFDDADKTVEGRQRALALAKTDAAHVAKMRADEDEETETMELTPELRARVEQLMTKKPTLTLPHVLPPPRSKKPPRR